jgi:hypothetical protein
MSGIVWLASYPKSGNTWFRVFLTNLQRNADTPADINTLEATPIASARHLFDEAVGYEAGDLTLEEIDRLRPRVYEHLAATAAETLYLKTHDAYTMTDTGEPLLATSATQGALYFLRNPLDVCVSFAHHSACDVEPMLRAMGKASYALAAQTDRLPNQLRQCLLSWSQHVLSWVEGLPFPVLVVRYEDMHQCPLETFARAAAFAGLPHESERVARALYQSRFAELQNQERAHGFHEKMPRATSFFRQGTIGSWRQHLTREQARRIVCAHREVMQRFGYLTAAGEPVF